MSLQYSPINEKMNFLAYVTLGKVKGHEDQRETEKWSKWTYEYFISTVQGDLKNWF